MNQKLQDVIVTTVPEKNEPGRGVAIIAVVGSLIVACLVIVGLWPGV